VSVAATAAHGTADDRAQSKGRQREPEVVVATIAGLVVAGAPVSSVIRPITAISIAFVGDWGDV
jgi:hypothetical protein